MFKNKKIILGLIVLLSTLFIWYLFIKQSDYVINFKAKSATATVYQGIKEWTLNRSKTQNENYSLIESKNFNQIKYNIKNNTENIDYTWNINPKNDSICAVQVAIKDNNNSIYNRLTILFNSDFKKQQIEKIKDFKKGLDEHLTEFKVKSVTKEKSPEVFVAYIELKSVMQEKAQTMIASDALITGYLFKNNIKIAGKPYLEVTNWNLDTEQLEFNYCFPIDKNTKYVENNLVKFKTIPAKNGLAVSYFGNMRKSDRGWFAIYDYAKKNNIQLDYKPLEHFFANPYNGGNELEWETQIIIPYLE